MAPERRQMLAIGIEPFKQGEEFTTWPLHITLLPWFENAKQSKLSDGLEQISTNIKRFHVDLGSRALFGARRDTPVRLIVDNPELEELHRQALATVRNAGASVDHTFTGKKYRPHVTEKHHVIEVPLHPVEQFALIDDLGHGTRHVSEVFELGT